MRIADFPEWNFDGSSTEQAEGDSSDCILKPATFVRDPLRPPGSWLVLCEVLDKDGKPGKNNYRHRALELYRECRSQKPLFGIEQEYTLFDGHAPLGWPQGGYAPKQGPFYCGVGLDEEFGGKIAEEHMLACLAAGIAWCGKNGEVMCGQHEFQVGPVDPIRVSDDLWLARYLLYKIAAKHGCSAKLDPKPNPDMNGAGAHTNFSTKKMREGADETRCGLFFCALAAESLGIKVTGQPICEGKLYDAQSFPEEYGTKFEQRLTGEHETCSFKHFKFGVADRTASIRIPLQVDKNRKGYIEDRRPCADADPYRIVSYIMETCCDV
jgi:glutamine synthetase